MRGFHDYLRDTEEGFIDPHWELEEIFGRREDDVVVVSRFTARGRGSGVPVDISTPQVWSFRNGKVLRSTTYPTLREALKAAGFSE